MVAVGASGALAGSPKGPQTTTCTGDMVTAPSTPNVAVPAGQTCRMLFWGEITGNVSVAGTLDTYGWVTIDGNVDVNGGALTESNWPLDIKGNLSISNSAGQNGLNGFFGPYSTKQWGGPDRSEVHGNFSYTYNSAPLYVGYAGLKVDGNFDYSNNAKPPVIDQSVFEVGGNSNI